MCAAPSLVKLPRRSDTAWRAGRNRLRNPNPFSMTPRTQTLSRCSAMLIRVVLCGCSLCRCRRTLRCWSFPRERMYVCVVRVCCACAASHGRTISSTSRALLSYGRLVDSYKRCARSCAHPPVHIAPDSVSPFWCRTAIAICLFSWNICTSLCAPPVGGGASVLCVLVLPPLCPMVRSLS